MASDPKMNAFRKIHAVPTQIAKWLPSSDEALKAVRAACTALLKVDETERDKVIDAANEMRGDDG